MDLDETPISTWVEIVAPVADAMSALAACIQDEAQSLAGASIAVSERGTLLLNQRAWQLCGHLLQTLPNLETAEAPLDKIKPVRFLLVPNK